MKELLIPFGVERDTGSIIEPEDAMKGRNCNCLCPGCRAPLMSRHPRINRIHFAHDSKHPDALPDDDCPLSPMVALMMMIKHIRSQFINQPLKMPSFNVLVSYPCCRQSSEFRLVQEESFEHIVAIEDGGGFGNVEGDYWHYDLIVVLNNHKILIEFFHPQKPSRALPDDLTIIGDHTSILSIDCSQFKTFIDSSYYRDQRYSEVVKNFVLSGAPKVFRYHYQQGRAIQRYKHEHKCSPRQPKHIQRSLFGGRSSYPSETYSSRSNVDRLGDAYRNASGGSAYPFTSNDGTLYRPSTANAITTVKYICTICSSCVTKPSNERPYCSRCDSYLTCRRIPG